MWFVELFRNVVPDFQMVGYIFLTATISSPVWIHLVFQETLQDEFDKLFKRLNLYFEAGDNIVTPHIVDQYEDKIVMSIPDGLEFEDFEKVEGRISQFLESNIKLTLAPNYYLIIKMLDKLPKNYNLELDKVLQCMEGCDWGFSLGKSDEGYLIHDLGNIPHMLIGGATTLGKTSGLRQGLLSMIYKYHPKNLVMFLCDLKAGKDMRFLKDAPHVQEIISTREEVLDFLNKMIKEMERRLRNPDRKHPRLLIVFDELAQFDTGAPSDIRKKNKKIHYKLDILTSKGRAADISIIASTQRPVVSVIKGNIKNNMQARVAFYCASATDSKTILDNKKAKSELKFIKGRALYQVSNPIKFQFPWVSKDKAKKLAQERANQLKYNKQYHLPKTDKNEEQSSTEEKSKKDNKEDVNYQGEVL